MKNMNLCNESSGSRIALTDYKEGDMAEQKFQWNAADYAVHSSAQLSWAEELINKLKLSGSEHILDLGCGDGKISVAIAKQLPQGRGNWN
jgi:cyclopropane fatty-acyl-phospholipid synthase-like methyltransferase